MSRSIRARGPKCGIRIPSAAGAHVVGAAIGAGIEGTTMVWESASQSRGSFDVAARSSNPAKIQAFREIGEGNRIVFKVPRPPPFPGLEGNDADAA
jgi:hypothetical protein